jgi:hypothetical protein
MVVVMAAGLSVPVRIFLRSGVNRVLRLNLRCRLSSCVAEKNRWLASASVLSASGSRGISAGLGRLAHSVA